MVEYKQYKNIQNNYKGSVNSNEQENKTEFDPFKKIQSNQQAEDDMWGWIYQEIANLRLECSKLRVLVRLNNRNSAMHLETYHSHIYSLLIPISVLIPFNQWEKIDKMWLSLKQRVDRFEIRKNNTLTLKIPFTLIRDLDKLHRLALLIAQQKGLGIRVSKDIDIDRAVENSIIGT